MLKACSKIRRVTSVIESLAERKLNLQNAEIQIGKLKESMQKLDQQLEEHTNQNRECLMNCSN